jgi:hypothetical protein
MRRSMIFLAAAVALAFAAPASAQGGGIGVGLIAGEPTGLTLKFPLSGNTAIDVAIGPDADGFDDDSDGQLHADWLIAPAIIARGNGVTIPLYLGVGGVLEFDDNGNADDEVDFGLRMPVGVAFELQRVPLEFFVEVAVELIFLDNGLDDEILDADGALGVRFYF